MKNHIKTSLIHLQKQHGGVLPFNFWSWLDLTVTQEVKFFKKEFATIFWLLDPTALDQKVIQKL